MSLILNVAAFQAGWWACVLGAAHGYPNAGASVAIAIVAANIAIAPQPRRELALASVAVLAGALFENALAGSGWIRYGGPGVAIGLAPVWIVAMWPLFASTLNVSLRSLKPRPWLAAAVGLAGGPLAYYGGAKLGALHFDAPSAALVAIAIGWGILTPALLASARRFDGYARP